MSVLPASTTAPLSFTRFEIRPAERLLLKDGQPAELGARAFDLLLALAERRERVVSKNELLELVWPGLVVEENNIAVQVNAVRKLLGPEVVATIPGRGYRFTAAPLEESATPSRPAEAATAVVEPSTPAPARLPTNLPRVLQALRGRTEDLAALGALLDQHELVSIIGAGGMGKTLLAQHLLAGRREAYVHGVCWVELATLAEGSALPGAIAHAAGLRLGAGEPLASLAAGLAPLQLLIALDNAEHLLDEVARVCQALADVAPGLRLLVTSQAPLKLPLERVYRIGPLAVPQGPLPAAQALEFSAVALFAERAATADARFQLSDANVAAVIELCRALDGQALAIELAAARASTLGVQRLASAMQDRLRLLTGGRNRAAPPRQQTLQAALAWSHGLLAPREQMVFRRLAVFHGSFSLELAQQVAADEAGVGLDQWDVVEALGELVERSLVAMVDDERDDGQGLPRYRLLDSPQVYARERLQAAAEFDTLRQRHAFALAERFAQEWDRAFSGELGLQAWARQLLQDSGNAQDAMAWLLQAGDARRALQVGISWLLALPNMRHAERQALAASCETLLPQVDDLALQVQGWFTLSRAAGLLSSRDVLAKSGQALALARRLAAEVGSEATRWLLYAALGNLLARRMVADDEAGTVTPELLAELRTLEDPRWPAARRIFQGVPRDVMPQRLAFRALLRQQWRLQDEAGADTLLLRSNLVDAELLAGDTEAALQLGEALLADVQGSRDDYLLMAVRMNHAVALLRSGRLAEARELLALGWPSALRLTWYPSYADHLALLLALEGRFESAAQLVGYADAAVSREDQFRQGNESDAIECAMALALAALGEVQCQRLRDEGRGLGDEQAAALAGI
ncbi:MAG TPA: winged helix-turn-helix domain-containing protein [Ideonella sp.]|uniref:ATP-binding protein n=1 Tax=Ideonella sp. TaxID=1929293 RepID=UPI002B671D5E|nr:winged helix-turn-helix domain-containing protein [Ideonella sp.]HSI49575.1 winged helix-turn-helix domain-containing protein [Ideonella sp.]